MIKHIPFRKAFLEEGPQTWLWKVWKSSLRFCLAFPWLTLKILFMGIFGGWRKRCILGTLCWNNSCSSATNFILRSALSLKLGKLGWNWQDRFALQKGWHDVKNAKNWRPNFAYIIIDVESRVCHSIIMRVLWLKRLPKFNKIIWKTRRCASCKKRELIAHSQLEIKRC